MTLTDLLGHCRYMSDDDCLKVQSAYEYAQTYHATQTRLSGAPYMTHLEHVATILANLNQQCVTIQAGLLHDILEDTDCVESSLTDQFGSVVCHLVKGVTKLKRIHYSSNIDQQAENYRRLFLAMADDQRVVFIKLADRLHNMRTIHFLPYEKQRRIARETLDIYAPLAHRFGIGAMKWELEDRSFSVIYRDDFNQIKSLISENRDEREAVIQTMCTNVEHYVVSMGVPATCSGRPKHFYSIYKKINKKNINFSQIFDLYGIRIITDTVTNCYQILGHIHAQYTPIHGRFKDYIAVPKSNLYQSLHTTVIGPNGNRIEIQIRTKAMHGLAEHGMAAHCMYKSSGSTPPTQADFSWLNQIIMDDDPSSNRFIENVKVNLYDEDVFVFTPKGDIMALPKGATILDAAFKIHTEIGLKYKTGVVNGDAVSVNYVLQNGDQIHIHTRHVMRPNLGWLDAVTTRLSKSRINAYFKRQDVEIKVTLGESRLKKVLIKHGFIKKKTDAIQPFLAHIQSNSPYKTNRSVLLAVANNELSAAFIVKLCKAALRNPQDGALPHAQRIENQSLVAVDGEVDVDVHVARCCQPLPGDPIVGVMMHGLGVTIHRRHCSTVPVRHSRDDIMPVAWIQPSQYDYAIHVQLMVIDRPNLLKDVLNEVSRFNINMSKVSTRLYDHGHARLHLTCNIPHSDAYDQLRQQLLKIEDVLDVGRNN